MRPTSVSDLANRIELAGGLVTALDVTASVPDRIRVDLTCAVRDSDHAEQVVMTLSALDGVDVGKVSDRTFLVHLGGKLSVEPRMPIRNSDDLSMIYTPGVARVSEAIAKNPADARRLTIKRNTVAVITDGSAVLGLGNLGPLAALPVMEGKAALFKQFAGIDAFPLCLDTQDTDELVATITHLAPGFAGINLEDIAAPRCFEVERRLQQVLDIPVFHDDQHGTAVVVLAALSNALKVVDREIGTVRLVMSGAGAAGTAVLRLLLTAGLRNVVVCDLEGTVHPSRPGLSAELRWTAENTNPTGVSGPLASALVDADVFVGLSAGRILTGQDIASMAADAIVFALANPMPEVDPIDAARHAAVVATGRSDFANQINNVLAFPGVFRGLIDAQSRQISTSMLLAAAYALAELVRPEELNAAYIIPSVFHPDVTGVVAAAVQRAAREEGVAEHVHTSVPGLPERDNLGRE